MPCRPSSPILGHSSRGKRSVLSISAAIGATSAAEKRWTCSRSASAVSPRPKSKGGIALGIMSLSYPLKVKMSGRVAQLDVDQDQPPLGVGRDEAQLEVDADRLCRKIAFHLQLALGIDLWRLGIGRLESRHDVDVDMLLAEILESLLELLRRELVAERLGKPLVENR